MMNPIFTRYLYFKNEVVNSLLWAMLEKQYDESLYWIYELYFSGFQEDSFSLMYEFYVMYCQEIYPQYDGFIDKLYQEWVLNKQDHCIIGTIVKLLVESNVSLTNMLRIRQHIKPIDDTEVGNTNLIEFETVRLTPTAIHKYNTLKLTKNMSSWSFLNKVACKYCVRRVTCDEFSILYPMVDVINFDNWLYYASYTPIWNTRIKKYNGVIDHDTKTVYIENEDFDGKYDYEPDEQSGELKKMLWGNEIEHYEKMTISLFCSKYGTNNVYRKKSIFISRNNV